MRETDTIYFVDFFVLFDIWLKINFFLLILQFLQNNFDS